MYYLVSPINNLPVEPPQAFKQGVLSDMSNGVPEDHQMAPDLEQLSIKRTESFLIALCLGL